MSKMDHTKSLCILLFALINLDVIHGGWIYPEIFADEGKIKGFPQVIVTVRSDDATITEYTLTGVGVDQPDYNGIQKFEIDASSGQISLLAELDREQKDKYVLRLSAFDRNHVEAEKPVDIEIFVKDENDCKPVFDPVSLSGTVSEGSGPGSPSFMTITATDDDDPSTYHADIIYKLVNKSDLPQSDSGDRFSVDPTGQVKVVGILDHEVDPTVKFMVEAIDNNGISPAHKVTATVTVKVTDSNDHAPVFDTMSDKSLSELSALNTPLYDMYATDVDEGVNKKVYFDIIDGNTGGTFTIVSTPSDSVKSKGELQLLKPLDYESPTTSYDLTIRAYNKEADNPADKRYEAKSHIRIKVVDENEPPEFLNTPYVARVVEEEKPEEPVPVIQILAEDYDFEGNQTVSYSVDDPERWFQIHEKTGQISRIGAVNREASVVTNGVYELRIRATDDYDHGENGSRNGIVTITITDINDNAPDPKWSKDEATVLICDKPVNRTVKVINPVDPDSKENGPPFSFRFVSTVDQSDWGFKKVSEKSQEVVALFDDYGLSGGLAVVELPFTITDSGSPSETGTTTLTVSICKCDDNGDPTCKDAAAAGFPVAIIIAIIAVLLLIVILIFALVAYKRRQAALVLKEPFFDDEDDVRENVQVYQEEGGEEDQEAYDLSALRAPLLEDPNQPVRIEKPLQQAPRQPRGHVPDDIGDYIGEAKDQADGDPSAPPFDSLLVFDYEGLGSDAGSLSSINTATTDGSVDYDYLNNWGPRFNKLAGMYNDGSDSE